MQLRPMLTIDRLFPLMTLVGLVGFVLTVTWMLAVS